MKCFISSFHEFDRLLRQDARSSSSDETASSSSSDPESAAAAAGAAASAGALGSSDQRLGCSFENWQVEGGRGDEESF